MDKKKIYSRFINNNARFIVAKNEGNDETYPAVPTLLPHYEIYYSIVGCEGFCLEDKYIEIEPHDLIIIPKETVHRSIAYKNPEYCAYIINFSEDIISNTSLIVSNMGIQIVNDPFEWINSEKIGKDLPYKVHLDDENHEKIMSLFDECRNAEQRKDMLKTYMCFLEILYLIEPLFKDSNFGDKDYKATDWIDMVTMYVEKNFRDNCMSVQDIANALHVSYTHLLEKFKEETKLTLNRYINLRRITEAQKLLYQGYLVKEVFDKVGYNSYSHFAKIFKKEIGCSPADFQKNTDKAWMQNKPRIKPMKYED